MHTVHIKNKYAETWRHKWAFLLKSSKMNAIPFFDFPKETPTMHTCGWLLNGWPIYHTSLRNYDITISIYILVELKSSVRKLLASSRTIAAKPGTITGHGMETVIRG